MSDPIIISGAGILFPVGRDYWTTPDMVRNGKPLYGISEVARGFFGRSVVWLRMRIFRGYGTADELGELELARTPSGHRRWHLHDIERMARIFLAEGALSMQDYGRTINCIKAAVYLHKFDIPDYRPLEVPLYQRLSPLRNAALQRVLSRLETEGSGVVDPDEEHLLNRTVWSWRELETYLETRKL